MMPSRAPTRPTPTDDPTIWGPPMPPHPSADQLRARMEDPPTSPRFITEDEPEDWRAGTLKVEDEMEFGTDLQRIRRHRGHAAHVTNQARLEAWMLTVGITDTPVQMAEHEDWLRRQRRRATMTREEKEAEVKAWDALEEWRDERKDRFGETADDAILQGRRVRIDTQDDGEWVLFEYDMNTREWVEFVDQPPSSPADDVLVGLHQGGYQDYQEEEDPDQSEEEPEEEKEDEEEPPIVPEVMPEPSLVDLVDGLNMFNQNNPLGARFYDEALGRYNRALAERAAQLLLLMPDNLASTREMRLEDEASSDQMVSEWVLWDQDPARQSETKREEKEEEKEEEERVEREMQKLHDERKAAHRAERRLNDQREYEIWQGREPWIDKERSQEWKRRQQEESDSRRPSGRLEAFERSARDFADQQRMMMLVKDVEDKDEFKEGKEEIPEGDVDQGGPDRKRPREETKETEEEAKDAKRPRFEDYEDEEADLPDIEVWRHGTPPSSPENGGEDTTTTVPERLYNPDLYIPPK